MRAGHASLAWFARHEMRLAWRDAVMMLQGGRRGRGFGAAIAVLIFSVVLHLVAYAALTPAAETLRHPDKAFFVALTGSAFLAWTLLFSQAMETVTRSFYARADLDLILSSPAAVRRLFAVRIGANAMSTVAMAVVLIGPVVDMAAYLGGPRLLFAYGVLVAMGSTALAAAVCATAGLFRLVGPKRTRLLAQIVAAVVGAGFVVGIQAGAILTYGSLSRTAMFRSPTWVAAAPGLDSVIWYPARAALGDVPALILALGGALGVLVATIAITSATFSRTAMTVAGLPEGRTATGGKAAAFRRRSRGHVLRVKEWTLLRRDPWLASQSLMQVLYLLPPALMLWRNYGTNGGALVVLVPVLVMAAGQLAGGLAWLAISGEDAPDLVATSPIPQAAILRAKVEAVMIAVALPIVPIAVVMACVSPVVAATTIVGGGVAAAGATVLQLAFKSQAKRSNFRRRQTSSRFATFAEAFLSISVAAASGFVAGGLWLYALFPAGVAAGVLLASHAIAGVSAKSV